MSDIGSELDAAIELVQGLEDRLLVKYPNHEYVAYLSIKNKTAREAAWQALLKRFSKEPEAEGNVSGAMEVTYALANYLIAMEAALDERPAPECSCARECDCEDPSPALGSALHVSNECPEHNENPWPNPDCLASVHWDNRRNR